MGNTTTFNFESVNHDFTKHQVLVKDNVYQKEWRNESLLNTFQYSSSNDQKLLRGELASYLYEIDPGIGYWTSEYDFVRIELKNIQKYKEHRRKSLKLVKYYPCVLEECKVVPVILDIDFKVNKVIYLDRLNQYKSRIRGYYEDHEASIFLVESASGLGFHLAMCFHSEIVSRKTYQQAYEFYAKEIAKITEIPNFMSFVDYSVAHIGADFYIGNPAIGTNGSLLFKNPQMSLKVVNEESEVAVQVTNEYTIESYHADFLLTYYFYQISSDCKAFTEYDKWIKMIIALVVTFQRNKERAYYWFQKFNQFSEKSKINKEENDSFFEQIFDGQLEAGIGVNYILKELLGDGFVRNYVPYSYDQVRSYFEQNHHLLKFNDAPITNDFDQKYVIENYISEQSEVLMNDKNILLIAPPNSGKSHHYLNQPNVIFLAPTSILRDDLSSNNTAAFKIQAQEDIIPNQQNYIGNYDAIYKLVNSVMNLKDYTLVIDEVHELFFSAHPNFRHRTVQKIVSSLGKFKNFVMLTGTPFQFNLDAEKFETYYFTKSVNRSPLLEIVSTPKPLQTMAQEILASKGKQLCYINDTGLISKVVDLIKDQQPYRNVIVFTSETKTEDEQQFVLQRNQLPENTVVLGTQMILEGISFKDNDITHLRFYQPILAEYIAQFSFRPRDENSPPLIVMYTRPKDYRHQKDAFPMNAFKTLEKKYLALLENIKINGIESEPIELQSEQNYRRLNLILDKKPELLPIILYENIGYELDYLFLGHLATDLANKKSSIDLFSLLIQLQKWNFKFTFRQAESSDVFASLGKKSKAIQINIIENHFEGLMLQDNVQSEQKLLFRAWALCKVINPRYFLNLSNEERVSFFTHDKIFKSAVLKVGIWAKENNLSSPYLSELIKILGLENLIQIVLVVKQKNTNQLISHEQLMGWLGLPPSKIKETKSKLRQYFEITNLNKNGTRSVNISNGELSVINSVMANEFEDPSPF